MGGAKLFLNRLCPVIAGSVNMVIPWLEKKQPLPVNFDNKIFQVREDNFNKKYLIASERNNPNLSKKVRFMSKAVVIDIHKLE